MLNAYPPVGEISYIAVLQQHKAVCAVTPRTKGLGLGGRGSNAEVIFQFLAMSPALVGEVSFLSLLKTVTVPNTKITSSHIR